MYGCVDLGFGFNSFDAELSGVEGLVQGFCDLLSTPSLDGLVQNWFHNYLTVGLRTQLNFFSFLHSSLTGPTTPKMKTMK